MNRLTQHFAAISRPQAPPPLPGESCYRVAHFAPFDFAPNWKPASVEDSIRQDLDTSFVEYAGRHREFLDALLEAREFNTWMIREDRPPARWATIAWIDNGSQEITEHFARVVTALRYSVLKLLAPSDWTPRTLLDAPPWRWSDEFSSRWSQKCRRTTADKAAMHAAKLNRGFRKRKRDREAGGLGAWWRVVVAMESEPTNSSLYLDCSGSRGVAASHESNRFHVVDATWPLAPATLAMIGGADHD